MLNQCNFIGRLGQDPESRFTQSGTQVVNVSLACSEKYKGEEHTEWVRIVAFGNLAEIMAQYLTKGSLCFISGKMQTRSYDDSNGVKKYSTEIIARDMKMLGGKSDSGQGNSEPPSQHSGFGGGTGGYVPF